jgi:hypothetical protein
MDRIDIQVVLEHTEGDAPLTYEQELAGTAGARVTKTFAVAERGDVSSKIDGILAQISSFIKGHPVAN